MSIWLTAQIFILNNLFCLFLFLWFLTFFLIDFDGYYIVRTDESQPRPKYIFNKCGTNIYFFTLQRFGPSTSPNFKWLNNFEDRAGLAAPLKYKEDKNKVFSVNALIVSFFLPNKYHISWWNKLASIIISMNE